MLPKFRQKALIWGFSINQLLFVSVFVGLYFGFFIKLVNVFGLIKSLIFGLILIGMPAAVLRSLNLNPNMLLSEWFYFKFIKPDIYLPGKRGGLNVNNRFQA